MSVLRRQTKTFDKAIALAFHEAQVEGMSSEVAHLLASTLDRRSLQPEMDRLIAAALKGEYGRDAEWVIQQWWPVPVPSPRYEARGLPSVVIETAICMVASTQVWPNWRDTPWDVTVVEATGKRQTTVLPLCFLQAMLDGKEDRYRVVAKDGSWVSLEIAGLRQPLRLHGEFVDRLRQLLRRKSVADWLEDFGSHGRTLAPLMVGTLLGLMYRRAGDRLPAGQEPWTRETLVEVLTGMGYSTARAQGVIERAEPQLSTATTLEEATRVMLNHIAQEVSR